MLGADLLELLAELPADRLAGSPCFAILSNLRFECFPSGHVLSELGNEAPLDRWYTFGLFSQNSSMMIEK